MAMEKKPQENQAAEPEYEGSPLQSEEKNGEADQKEAPAGTREQTAPIGVTRSCKEDYDQRAKQGAPGCWWSLAVVCCLIFGVNFYTLIRSGASIWNWILLVMALGLGLAFVCAARGEQKKRRAARYYDQYLELVRSQGSAAIRELAASVDLAEKQVRKHLKAMQKSAAYRDLHIDFGSGRVLDANAQTQDKAQGELDNDAAQVLAAIRGLNEAIGNEAISESIRRMEEYTDKIFRYVAKYPQKRPQVDKFMKYYLPTAVNLLQRYQELEEHRVDSARVSGQMQSISDTISKLADTFGKQLESLLMDDEMDINAEMKVLEDMLEADGLTGDGFPKL